MKKRLLSFIAIIVLIACTILIIAKSGTPDLSTWYEKSNCLETPRYDATIEYCKTLEDASDMISLQDFGVSPQGRDLPLVVVDKNGNFDAESVRRSGNAVLLIQACIHAGEPDGKDAGLMFIRDVAITKKYPGLLEHLTILFIPIFNVDGHERFGPYNRINQVGPKEMGWRTTARNLNLNRDYLKSDAPEMAQWHKLFNKWLPDFVVDCHVTDGADYIYQVTYGMEVFGNTEINLSVWMKDVYIKSVKEQLTKENVQIFPYVAFRNWHDPRSGLMSWVCSPMLSGGYCAVQNRPALLIETHMLKDYKTRVTATFEVLKATAELLNSQYKTLIRLNSEADSITSEKTFRENQFALSFEPGNDSEMVAFKGIEYAAAKSAITGQDWYKFGSKPADFTIPYFNHQHPKDKVKLPEAYIIPPEWTDVIERLDLHGIEYSILKEATSIKISTYKFSNVNWNTRPYEGRQRVERFDYSEITEDRLYPAGSVVVDMNQRTARVIAHIFEPRSPDSFLNWGFFNAIFEQKEYGESYVIEPMAAEMLAKNPELKKEFEEKKAKEPEFANDPENILNWFYSKSPWWDNRKDIYPVGRIMDRNKVDLLKVKTE